jgi:MoxR-like ATPase
VLEHLLVRGPPGLGKTKQAMEWATGRFREPQRVRHDFSSRDLRWQDAG